MVQRMLPLPVCLQADRKAQHEVFFVNHNAADIATLAKASAFANPAAEAPARTEQAMREVGGRTPWAAASW